MFKLTLRLARVLIRFLFIVLLFPLEGLCKRGGYLTFQFLCYQNPGHLDSKGHGCDTFPAKNCDPFFIICISNKPIKGETSDNCPVFYFTTGSYDNLESVCSTPTDNRGVLAKISEIELPYPLQEVFYIRIVVKDSNQFSDHQLIAVFSTSFKGIPSPNANPVSPTVISLNREEYQIYNPQARLNISIGLKCDWNLYGNLCATFCRAADTDPYICSEDGSKKCKSGWLGPECLIKDRCLDFQCAIGASCVSINGIPKCICNGIIGPQCYPNYNPCNPNPCYNGGVCVVENAFTGGVSCNCKSHYHGSRCELKFDLCQMVPCQNNGTCVELANGTRMCKCISSFKGILCDHEVHGTTQSKIVNTTNGTLPIAGYKIDEAKKYGVIFGVLFGVCVLFTAIIGIYFFVAWRQRKRDNKKDNNKEHSTCLKDVPHKSRVECVSNEYGECKDEIVYDTIDERATYIYQLDHNDDYLVPSRPTTPTTPVTHHSSSSDYLPMFNNDDLYCADDVTKENTKENEYLPPLPTRKAAKKHFNICRNF